MVDVLRTGNVYRLHRDTEGLNKCYVGSTMSPFVSIRMAHHRQHHRRCEKDYEGLFDGGDPQIEILEKIEFMNPSELRKLEGEYLEKYKDSAINLRCPYVSPDEAKARLYEKINVYQKTPKGKIALRKSFVNLKLKDVNITPAMRKHYERELVRLCSLREQLNNSIEEKFGEDEMLDVDTKKGDLIVRNKETRKLIRIIQFD